MLIRRLVLSVVVVILGSLVSRAGEPEPTWVGLTGLYTQPTAEIQQRGVIALNYAEIRFKQVSDNTKLSDIWFTGGVTVAADPRWEFAVLWRNEGIKTGPGYQAGFANMFNEAIYLGDVKYVITPPEHRKVGIAIGVIDITGATKQIGTLDTKRGQRYFLVGSLDWAHLAVTCDNSGAGVVAGGKFVVTDDVDLLAEFVSRPLFSEKTPKPLNNMNFNLGFRIYPPQVPRLHIDLTAVGDGEFDFGFALGYSL